MFTVGFFPPHPLAPQSYLHPFCLHCPLPGPQCPWQSCPVPTRHTQGCCFLCVPSTELGLSPWVPQPGDTCVTGTPRSAPSRTLYAQKMSFILLYLGYIWISKFPCIFKKLREQRFGNSSRGRWFKDRFLINVILLAEIKLGSQALEKWNHFGYFLLLHGLISDRSY